MRRTPAASSTRTAPRRHSPRVVFPAVRRRASHPCSRMRSLPTTPSLRRSHFGRDFEAELAAAASRRWRPSFRMGCGDTALFIQSFSLRTATLPESANRQRATMQTPQGLDARHRGELFPVNESYATPQSLTGAMLLSLLLATREKPGSGRLGSKTVVRQTGIENSFAGRNEFWRRYLGSRQRSQTQRV